jgi:hypothetical protein
MFGGASLVNAEARARKPDRSTPAVLAAIIPARPSAAVRADPCDEKGDNSQ